MPRCFVAVFLAALCFGQQQQEDLTIKLNVELIQLDVTMVRTKRENTFRG